MGKNLKGKELGTGLSQRKDGRFSARFTSKNGKRVEKYFDKLQDAKIWMTDAMYDDEHGIIGSNMTVDAWFDYWINNIKAGIVRFNTMRNYTDRYTHNISKLIGKMPICDVLPLHCQNILNKMFDDDYAYGTMVQCRITMYNMFNSACENELIATNPIKKSVKCKYREPKKRKVLTIDEQKLFLEVADNTKYYDVFTFALQTGMRAGEIIGLKWNDVDFTNKIIRVERTMQFRRSENKFVVGDTKTANGKREIPITNECMRILEKRARHRPKITNIEFSDLVFLNSDGLPGKNSSYDSSLFKIARRMGTEVFSMHSLRHTFATRCIECGMRPKTLQIILGHSNIQITMNLYVHVTDDEKHLEMDKLSVLNEKMA
jgi:integrase